MEEGWICCIYELVAAPYIEKDYFGNAVASDNVIVIDATKCMINAPKDKLVVGLLAAVSYGLFRLFRKNEWL